MTTSSRMTFAFARDGGLPASAFWWKVHPKLGVPLNALYLNVVVVVVFGCIYLGSTVAFNAIIAASVVALGVSYGMFLPWAGIGLFWPEAWMRAYNLTGIPVALCLAAGRRNLPERAFALPSWLGWTANVIGLVYTIVTTVLFLFPPALPVSGASMVSKFSVKDASLRNSPTSTMNFC